MATDQLKRAVHVDFHTMPKIYDFGRDFDAVVFAQRLSDANVTAVNVFAVCNIGFAYYPTKVGIPYPYMKEDLLGSMIRECHKRGIKVIAYINTTLNHEQAIRHPEWSRMGPDGCIIGNERTGNFFRRMCLNSKGYRNFVAETVKEIFEYDVDGLFGDCLSYYPACYCSECTKDMIAQGYDITNEQEVRAFSYKSMYEFSKIVREAVPEGKYFQLNGAPLDTAFNEMITHGEIECLPGGRWGYDFFLPKVSYVRNLKEDVLYMTGRFQKSWADFGGFKTKASLENDFYDALCQNAQFSMGDHMHPAENLEKHIYDTLGDIYQRLQKYEKWTDSAKYFADIGIVRDKTYIGKDGERGGIVFNKSNKGAVHMISELKYSFEVINEDMDFGRFKLIILPDDIYMSGQLCEKLKNHMALGGKVLSSGFGGVNPERTGFALEEWNFLSFEGADQNNSGYYRLYDDKSNMKWGIYSFGILMKAYTGDIASYIKPYFNSHWDGLHGYFYTPPEKETEYSAAAVNGNVGHICFKVFESYSDFYPAFHKNLVAGIIDRLLPNPLIKTEGIPSTALVTTTGTEDYNLIHVKVTYPEMRGKVGVIEEHNILPAGTKVSLKGKYSFVGLLPSETPVPFVYENGYTKITLPQIIGYDMFVAVK